MMVQSAAVQLNERMGMVGEVMHVCEKVRNDDGLSHDIDVVYEVSYQRNYIRVLFVFSDAKTKRDSIMYDLDMLGDMKNSARSHAIEADYRLALRRLMNG